MPLTEKQLFKRDAKRDIGKELLQAIRDVHAGQQVTAHKIEVNKAVKGRSGKVLSSKTVC